MLSLGIKLGEYIDLYTQIRKHIEEFVGKDSGEKIEAPLKNFQGIRNELLQFASYQKNPSLIEKTISSTNVYISMWSCISKNLSFGIGKVIFLNKYREELM